MRYLAFSFLCTLVPGSEKSIENFRSHGTFRGTFAPGERIVQELSFHGTFAPLDLELSLLRSECSKNFHSMELSHPWNICYTNNFLAL